MDSTTSVPDISLKKYDKVILAVMAGGLLVVLGGIGWGIYTILPLLVTMAENGVVLLGLLIVGVLLTLGLMELAMNFSNFLLHMKMTAQSIRRKVISSNPIAAIDVSINNLKSQYAEASRLSVEADGATTELEKQIRADDHKSGVLDKAENEDRLSQVALSQGRPDEEVKVHLTMAERWHRAGETLQPMLDRQRARQARIEKARQVARARITDMENQKDVLQITLHAFEADAKQSRVLGAFFGQGSKDMANIEIAVDEIVKQGALAEAQIDQMLRDSEPAIQSAQLQNDADAMAARVRLAALTGPKGITAGGVALPLPTKDGVIVGQK